MRTSEFLVVLLGIIIFLAGMMVGGWVWKCGG